MKSLVLLVTVAIILMVSVMWWSAMVDVTWTCASLERLWACNLRVMTP